jgi:hypothetical protein
MRKDLEETDEQFKARRRGVATAMAAAGGLTGGQFIPPELLRRKVSRGLADSAEQIKVGEALDSNVSRELAEQRKAARDLLTFGQSTRSAEERSKERVRRKREGFTNSSLLGRGMTGLGGAAMMGKNIPLLGAAKGSQMLYHGTGSNAIAGILGDDPEQSGLRLEYAGKKGRLNAALMPNAVVKQILEHDDINLDDQELARIQDKINHRIKANKGTPIATLIREEIDDLAKFNKIPENVVKDLKGNATKALREAGMRIYFGNSPDKIMHWADDMNEADKIKAQLSGVYGGGDGSVGDMLTSQAKGQLKAMLAPAHIATGGIYDEIKGMKGQHDYLRDLDVHPEAVSPEFIRDLAAKNESLHFGFGSHIPTDDVQMLADFKGIRTPLRLSPGIQATLGSIPGFHGYNPNQDISTGRDVARSAFKHVDVLDPETKKTTRYMLNSYEAPKLSGSQRLKSLGRGALPLALTGLGADAVYRAVSGRRGVLGRAIDKYRERHQEKTGAKDWAPLRSAAKDTLRYGIPTLGAGFALSAVADKIGRGLVPVTEAEYAPTSLDDDIEGMARESTRAASGGTAEFLLGLGASGLSGLIGSKVGIHKLKKALPELHILAGKGDRTAKKLLGGLQKEVGLMGAGVGAAIPGMAQTGAALMSTKYEDAARGRDEFRTEIGESSESQMKTPWKSAVLPGLVTAGVLGTTLGSTRKHFPGLIKKTVGQLVARVPHMAPNKAEDMLTNALEAAREGKIPGDTISSLMNKIRGGGDLGDMEFGKHRALADQIDDALGRARGYNREDQAELLRMRDHVPAWDQHKSFDKIKFTDAELDDFHAEQLLSPPDMHTDTGELNDEWLHRVVARGSVTPLEKDGLHDLNRAGKLTDLEKKFLNNRLGAELD